MSRKTRHLLIMTVTAVSLGAGATAVFAVPPGFFVNGTRLGQDEANFTNVSGKKITIRLPENFEVACEKVKSPAEAGIFDAGGPDLVVGPFTAEECNRVTNLGVSEEEKCEVENKSVQFNELAAEVPWIEATGAERYVYFDETLHNGKWEGSDPLWATIKIKSKTGKTCPSLLVGMHPLNGTMLAKLKLPTSEQVRKTFTSMESGGLCGRATTYYAGEPRTSHAAEGLMIGGEKHAELCGEFEIELNNGSEFSVS